MSPDRRWATVARGLQPFFLFIDDRTEAVVFSYKIVGIHDPTEFPPTADPNAKKDQNYNTTMEAPRRAPRRSGSIFSKRPESRNRLPTQSIAAARSEFERAARRRANRALPSSCAAGTSRSKTAIFTQLLCA